jgi:hypothetical protein
MPKATWEEEIYPDGHVERGHIKGATRQSCDAINTQYATMGNMVSDESLPADGFRDEVHETHS